MNNDYFTSCTFLFFVSLEDNCNGDNDYPGDWRMKVATI